MELIDIISTILLFGGGLLIVVVGLSYFISRLKRGEAAANAYGTKETHKAHNNPAIYTRKVNPAGKYLNVEQRVPQIFQLDQIRPREVKMIRKPTARETLTGESLRFKTAQKTNGEKNRYTIINEEQKKSRGDAVNYM